MKRSLLFFVFCVTLLITPVLTQAQLPAGMSVTCDDGTSFDNGVEVSISQLRAGYSYTATAIGLNGFDPVLAVLNAATGEGLCNDDNTVASYYEADLPSTGYVPPSELSSQVTFHHNDSSGFADVSLVVGGYGNTSGEFLLILEGMGATTDDGVGDPFSVNITPGMVNSGVPLTVYMISRENTNLDPYIFESDGNLNPSYDTRGNAISCDDAGDVNSCWGNSADLSNSSVTLRNGTLPGGPYDAMLSIPLSNLQLNNDPTLNYLTFVMTSSPVNTTYGQYLLVFDIGQSDTGKAILNGGSQSQGNGGSSQQGQGNGGSGSPGQGTGGGLTSGGGSQSQGGG